MNNRQIMIAFADHHLAPYVIRNDELVPDFCPICRGGENGDKHTFALNLNEGVYVCKRGTCGARGRFEDLSERFGERADIVRSSTPKGRRGFAFPNTE